MASERHECAANFIRARIAGERAQRRSNGRAFGKAQIHQPTPAIPLTRLVESKHLSRLASSQVSQARRAPLARIARRGRQKNIGRHRRSQAEFVLTIGHHKPFGRRSDNAHRLARRDARCNELGVGNRWFVFQMHDPSELLKRPRGGGRPGGWGGGWRCRCRTG